MTTYLPRENGGLVLAGNGGDHRDDCETRTSKKKQRQGQLRMLRSSRGHGGGEPNIKKNQATPRGVRESGGERENFPKKRFAF